MYSGRCFVLALLYQILAHSTCSPEILQSPRNTTVFLNTNAIFNCSARNFDSLIWYINGISRNANPKMFPNTIVIPPNPDNVTTLTIPGTREYNGTRVHCTATQRSRQESVTMKVSENVTMYVQGKLGPVGNLENRSSGRSVLISWTAPFSLDVTDEGPNISYILLIRVQNVTKGINSILALRPHTNITHYTKTSYTFTPDDPDPCILYNFTVTPYNGAGQGEPNHIVYSTNPEPNITLNFEKSRINKDMDRIYFTFKGHIKGVCFYILYIMDRCFDLNLISSMNGRGTVLYQTNVKFPPNIVRNATCEVGNAATSVNLTVDFSTFDVQEVWTRRKDNGVEVTAELIKESEAKGCLVVVECGKSYFFRALLRKGNHNMAAGLVQTPPMKDGRACRVMVYDIEETGLPENNSSPAVVVEGETDTFHEEDVEQSHSKSHVTVSMKKSKEDVMITCKFANDYPEESCVVIYHDHHSMVLIVEECDSETQFPLKVTSGDYSIAVFGMDARKEMDQEPQDLKASSAHCTGSFFSFLAIAFILIMEQD